LTGRESASERPRDLQMLDVLIEKGYQALVKQETVEIKLGELIKMIETRRKLTPQGGDQKKFWEMIDNLRRESLGKSKSTPPKRRAKRKVSGESA